MIADIARLLPHGPPVRLLERVVSFSSERLVAETTIRAQTVFCRDPRGVPAWIGLEYLGQAAAAYFALAAQPGGVVAPGMLVACRRYRCSRPFFAPGWVLTIRIWPETRFDAPLVRFAGEIIVEGDVVATGQLSVYVGAPTAP